MRSFIHADVARTTDRASAGSLIITEVNPSSPQMGDGYFPVAEGGFVVPSQRVLLVRTAAEMALVYSPHTTDSARVYLQPKVHILSHDSSLDHTTPKRECMYALHEWNTNCA